MRVLWSPNNNSNNNTKNKENEDYGMWVEWVFMYGDYGMELAMKEHEW